MDAARTLVRQSAAPAPISELAVPTQQQLGHILVAWL